jgi:hypothetical protein
VYYKLSTERSPTDVTVTTPMSSQFLPNSAFFYELQTAMLVASAVCRLFVSTNILLSRKTGRVEENVGEYARGEA